MFRSQVAVALTLLFVGCDKGTSLSTQSRQPAVDTKLSEPDQLAQSTKEVDGTADNSKTVDEVTLKAEAANTPESLLALKSLGETLFHGLKEANADKVRATFPTTPEVQKWIETLTFTDPATATIFKEQVVKRSEKLPEVAKKELENTQKIAEKLGIDWSKAELVSSVPYGIDFETRGGFSTFKGIKILFQVDEVKYSVESGAGMQLNAAWRFFNPWKEIVKIQ